MPAFWEAMIAAVMKADMVSPLNSPRTLSRQCPADISNFRSCMRLPAWKVYYVWRAQESPFTGSMRRKGPSHEGPFPKLFNPRELPLCREDPRAHGKLFATSTFS